MNISDVRLRDPYIMLVDDTYYMYGSRTGAGGIESARKIQNGLDVYRSRNLSDWSKGKSLFGEKGFYEKNAELWAPEVYRYKNKYYMFVTLKRYGAGEKSCRGTYVFKSDTPDGEFKLHSDSSVTPHSWECLDGSLYFENGRPYMIFCHEWAQVKDGKFCCVEMDEDLKGAVGDVSVLFSASDAEWVSARKGNVYVSDGPFMFKDDGVLYMLWSSFTEKGYAIGISYSESGCINGEWRHAKLPLYNGDGGHAMLFNTVKNERKIIFHTPNDSIRSSPKITDFIKIKKGSYSLFNN